MPQTEGQQTIKAVRQRIDAVNAKITAIDLEVTKLRNLDTLKPADIAQLEKLRKQKQPLYMLLGELELLSVRLRDQSDDMDDILGQLKDVNQQTKAKIDKIKKVNTGVTTGAETVEKLATKAPKLIKQVGDVLGRVDAILNP